MGTSKGARKGHTPESDAKRREAMIARWQDPEYRAKVLKASREAQGTDESRARKAEAARQMATPEVRDKRRRAMQRKWDDPEYRAKREALEATPEMKQARAAAMQETNNRPEKRQRHSEFMKDRYATDEEFREAQQALIQRNADDPAVKLARSEAMKRAWTENPELFVNSLRATLEAAQSPEGREQRRQVFARRAAAAPVTPYEHVICLVLNEFEIPYFAHKVNEGKEMDVYVPSRRLDIEVDGGNHVGKGAVRDEERDAFLRERGYIVLRLKHGEIMSGSFVRRLQEALGLATG
jgi:Protein of unknown function (DUF559)